MGVAKPSKKQRGKDKANKKHLKFNDDGELQVPANKPNAKPKRKAKTKTQTPETNCGKTERSPEMIQSVKYYLESWAARDQPLQEGQVPWKFKKIKQAWILNWMYEADVVPKSMFALVLEYLKGIQGAARERVLQSAQEIIDKGEPEKVDRDDPPEDGEQQDAEEAKAKAEASKTAMVLARRKFKRALQVAELLA